LSAVVPRLSAAVIAAVLLTGAWGLASAGTQTACNPRVPWTQLRFGASKFFLSATATMGVEQVPADEARSGLRSPPEGTPLVPGSPCLAKITVTTKMPFGRSEEVTVWIDPSTGAAEQYEKVASGGSPYHKIGRYTRDGYYLWRTSPANGQESSRPPSAWSHRKSHYSSWGGELPTGAVVTDPYALLFLISAASRGEPGTTMPAYVYADGHLVELSFTAKGTTSTHVSFTESWDGGSRKRKGDVPARAVRVSAAGTAGHGGDAVNLGFLGMRGALTILLDPASGVPLAVEGDVEHLGELEARLEKVELRAPPSGQ